MRDAEKLGDDEINGLLADLPGWSYSNDHLEKSFKFANFSEALGFMVRAGLAAEQLDHHPNWYNVYNKVDIQLWTHDAAGVTALDIKLAKTMNEIAGVAGS
jgi:4a-hydroxytetrahydrobiopterin dehydratase